MVTGGCNRGSPVFGAEVLLDEHDRLAGGDIELVEKAPGAAADRLAARAHLSLGFGPGGAGESEGVRRDSVLADLHQARAQERGETLQKLPILTGQSHGPISRTVSSAGI